MVQSYMEIKEKARINYKCECGGSCVHSHKSRHNRSKKHQAYLTEHPDMVEPEKEKKKVEWIFMF